MAVLRYLQSARIVDATDEIFLQEMRVDCGSNFVCNMWSTLAPVQAWMTKRSHRSTPACRNIYEIDAVAAEKFYAVIRNQTGLALTGMAAPSGTSNGGRLTADRDRRGLTRTPRSRPVPGGRGAPSLGAAAGRHRPGTRHAARGPALRRADEVADEVVFLDDGKVVEIAPPNKFFANPTTERAREFAALPVRANGFIFTGGYVPLDPETGEAVLGPIEDQFRTSGRRVSTTSPRTRSRSWNSSVLVPI